jgi:hypothetical protein
LDRLPCRRAFGTVRRTDAHRDGAGAGDVNSGAWKLPELWTHRTRPQLLGKRADRVFHSYHTPSTTCYPCLQTNLLPMSPAVPPMAHGPWPMAFPPRLLPLVVVQVRPLDSLHGPLRLHASVCSREGGL